MLYLCPEHPQGAKHNIVWSPYYKYTQPWFYNFESLITCSEADGSVCTAFWRWSGNFCQLLICSRMLSFVVLGNSNLWVRIHAKILHEMCLIKIMKNIWTTCAITSLRQEKAFIIVIFLRKPPWAVPRSEGYLGIASGSLLQKITQSNPSQAS